MAAHRKESRSDAPGPDLGAERDQLLRTFTRGGLLTREFVEQYEALQGALLELRSENGRLRSIVEADDAIRDLIRKIEALETEKRDLLGRFARVEARTSDFDSRLHDLEDDFANLANLYVASNSLHSSLSPRAVTRRLREVLEQLVGAAQFGIYLSTRDGRTLHAIAEQGLGAEAPTPEALVAGRVGEVARSGVARIDDDADPSQGTLQSPPAVFPLQIDDNVVGVVAIFRSFEHKKRFSTVDFELFKLLGQHAAGALMSAGLYAQAGRRLPGPEAFAEVTR